MEIGEDAVGNSTEELPFLGDPATVEDPAGGISKGSDLFLASSKKFLEEELRVQTLKCLPNARVRGVEVLASSTEVIDGLEVNMSVKVIGSTAGVEPRFHSIVVDWDVPDGAAAAEEQAEQDHLAFMTETGKSLAQKNEAVTLKTHQKGDVETKLDTATDNLDSQTVILQQLNMHLP